MSHLITTKLASIRTTPTSLLAILIYSAGIVGFTTWTIVDFIPLLDEYRNQNVDTQVSISRNDTAWPPDLTVCIPYYSDSLTTIAEWLLRGAPTNSCMECDALEQRGWNVWSDFNDSIMMIDGEEGNMEATKTSLAIAFLRRIVNESSTNGLDCLTLNRSNFNWNQPLLDAVWAFLTDLLGADSGFLMGQPTSTMGLLAAEIAEETVQHGRQILDELLIRSLAAIEIYFQRRTIFTTSELWRSTYVAPLGNSVFPTHIGVCFRATNGARLEKFKYIAFADDEIEPPWIRSPRSRPFAIYMDDHIKYGTAPIIETVYQTIASDTSMKFNYEVVHVDFKLDLKVVETRPDSDCIRNETLHHCAVRHFAEGICQKCSCLPFKFRNMFPNIPNTVPYCTVGAYSKCSSSFLSAKTPLSILDICSNQCEFISRRSNHLAIIMEDESSRDLHFGISFTHQADTPYVEFSIVAKTSWQKFISNIGGTVGIYLGFSGLSIVALFVSCMKHVGNWLSDRKRKATSQEDGENRNHTSEDEDPTKSAVNKRLLDMVAEMIREQQRVAREEMLELMKTMEERIVAFVDSRGTY